MTDILPRDILLYAGGDAWRRFGTFTRRTARIQRGGEGQQETFSRADAATCASYLGRDGLYHLAAAGVMRPHWVDTNGDGIPDTLTYLGEPGATNRALQSQAWATSPWANNTVTPTNNAATAPDGTTTATKLLPNNTVTAGFPDAHQGAITITSGEFVAAQWCMKANGYPAVLLSCADGSRNNGFNLDIDLTSGTIGSRVGGIGAGVLTGSDVIALGNGWYWIGLWGQINAAVTTALLWANVFDTLGHANSLTNFTADGVSSLLGWGAQLERNGAVPQPPTSYIATGASQVTRAADACTLPFAGDVVPVTLYAKFVELGALALSNQTSRIIALGDTSASNPRLILTNSGGKYQLLLITPGNVQVVATAAAAPAYGNVVELVGSYDGLNTVTLTQAINGAAAAPVSTTGAGAIAGTWAAAVASLLCNGAATANTQGGLIRALMVNGVHTLAECQAVP